MGGDHRCGNMYLWVGMGGLGIFDWHSDLVGAYIRSGNE